MLSQFGTSLALIVKMEDLVSTMITTAAFVMLGLIIFGAAFAIVVRVTPFSVKKEIEEDHNLSLSVLIGSMIIGISIIIAAAISG